MFFPRGVAGHSQDSKITAIAFIYKNEVNGFYLSDSVTDEQRSRERNMVVHIEPYQPHSILPIGRPTLSQGPRNSFPSPLSPPEKASTPKLKYEALEISEIRWSFEKQWLCITVTLGPFESKVFTHYNCYWGPFESNVLYFTRYSCKGGPRQVPCLPSLKHTTVYNPDNDLT